MKVRRYSLAIDGEAPSDLLSDLAALHHVVLETAKAADMRLLNIASSNVDEITGREPDESGWSVVGTITTSHIAIHAWPHYGRFMFDFVSCRPFNHRSIVQIIMRKLKPTELKIVGDEPCSQG